MAAGNDHDPSDDGPGAHSLSRCADERCQAARLAGRDDLLGKIVALQRDPEEEPQGRGTDIDGRYRRPDRRQPQLIAMDILWGGPVGRPDPGNRQTF